MKKIKIVVFPLILTLLTGCSNGNKPVTPDTPVTPVDPDTPVDPSESNGVFEHVLYAAKKYNPNITRHSLEEASGLAPSKSTDYTYLFKLLYHGFKDSLPKDLKGMRGYTGDFEKHLHPNNLQGDEKLAYQMMCDAGLVSENYIPKNPTTTATADLYLKRIHAYIGTSFSDDFAMAANYDWCIAHDPLDRHGPNDNVKENNIVNSGVITVNAMDYLSTVINDPDYSGLSGVYDYYISGKQDALDSHEFKTDIQRILNVNSMSQLVELAHEDFSKSGISGLMYYVTDDLLGAGNKNATFFRVGKSRHIYELFLASSYQQFYNECRDEIDSYFNAISEYLPEEISAEEMKGYYIDFLKAMRNKFDNKEGYYRNSSLRGFYPINGDPINHGDSNYVYTDIIGENMTTDFTYVSGGDALSMEYIMDLASSASNYQMIRSYLLVDYFAHYYPNLHTLANRSNDFLLVNMVGYNLTAAYQESTRYENDYQKTYDLFNSLITALKDNAVSNGWLTQAGIEALKTKANAVSHSLYCEYQGEKFTFGNVLNNSFTTDMGLNLKTYHYNKTKVYDWFMNQQVNHGFTDRECSYLYMEPFTPNAYYVATTNSIYITMGYNFSKPKIETMAKEELLACYGLVMGHEITHGFDSSGCYFDADGNYVSNSIFPIEDLIAFEGKQQDVISLYNYEVMPGINQSGSTTLTEDLADIGGLGLSLRIAQSSSQFNYSSYFTLLAQNMMYKASRFTYFNDGHNDDVHAFGRARINPLLMGNRKFQETFNLNENDGMYHNIDESIVVW